MSEKEEEIVVPEEVKIVDKKNKNADISQPEPPKTLIYIGNTLPNLQKYTVFNNGIPQFVVVQVEKCKAIGELIVPLSEFNTAKDQLNKKGTRYHTLNTSIQLFIKGVKVNGV